jgi:hypothetical protein
MFQIPFFNSSAAVESQSSRHQYYEQPNRFQSLLGSLLFNGLLFTFLGGGILYTSSSVGSYTWFALALITHVMGVMMLIGFAMSILSFVTKLVFTFDSVYVYQRFRKPIRLPYNEYSFQWIADFSATGNVRLLMIDQHRGCIVYSPPDWLRENFAEISRIQMEEGWYAPQDGEVAKQLENSTAV